MKDLRIGFDDPTQRAICLDQLPDWVPIVAGDLMVVAMVDDLSAAPVFAEALTMRDKLRDVERMLGNLIGDLISGRPINRANCEGGLRTVRDDIRQLLKRADGQDEDTGHREKLVRAMWKHQREGLQEPRPLPKLNIKCETGVDMLGCPATLGITDLPVIRVEAEDDGSFTAVTDYWPSADYNHNRRALQRPHGSRPCLATELAASSDFDITGGPPCAQ